MKIVFLHGIGNGDPEHGWLDGLNDALRAAGHPVIDERMVIAPRYASLLNTEGLKAKEPKEHKGKRGGRSRRDFELRQAEVRRLLQHDSRVTTFGFGRVPDALAGAARNFGAKNLPVFDLPMVKRYVNDDGCRATILGFLREQLPTRGEIILIGHSLGSVIAIDLLDQLPPNLRVRRFITIGSPANCAELHARRKHLLNKVPYDLVDDWSNFFSYGDPVPMGRGLAAMFPGAQDFAVSLGPMVHAAKRYLSQPSIVRLIADVLYPPKDLIPAGSDIVVRLGDDELVHLVKLHFAWILLNHIADSDRRNRFQGALTTVQHDVIAHLRQRAIDGIPMPAEFHALLSNPGRPPHVPQNRLELRDTVSLLIMLTATNFIDPYEIDTEDAARKAVPDMLAKVGFSRGYAAQIHTALDDVDDAVTGRGGLPLGKIGIAAAGLALMAAGPIGLAVAAPAGAFGGAAITGALAAFGPGGMIGGLSMLGGLAASGAGLTAAAAFSGSGPDAVALNVTQLRLQVAAAYAHHLLKLPEDRELWHKLTVLETQVAAELNRLETFSDPKAERLQYLRAARTTVARLLVFLTDKQIAGAPGSLPAAPSSTDDAE